MYNDNSVACDMTYEQFRNLCNKCWSEKYGFIIIDTESDLNKGRYRKCFDNFVKKSY